MKVWIDYDEWYPVYNINEEDISWGLEAEVSREFYEYYQDILGKFHVAQNTIGDLHDEANKKKKLEEAKNGRQSIGFRALSKDT